jgi:hypothetical protein
MSLNWDIREVKDHESMCYVPTGEKDDEGKGLTRVNPVTDALIWLTMGVDIGVISEETIDEFIIRMNMWEKLYAGSLVDGDGKQRMPTREEVEAHIGLRTNVGTRPMAEWWAGMGESLQYTIAHRLGTSLNENYFKASDEDDDDYEGDDSWA